MATAVAVMAFIPFSAPVTSLLLMSGMSTLPMIFSLGPCSDILFWDSMLGVIDKPYGFGVYWWVFWGKNFPV